MTISIENRVAINMTYNILYMLFIMFVCSTIFWASRADDRYLKSRNKMYQLAPVVQQEVVEVVHPPQPYNSIVEKTLEDKHHLAQLAAVNKLKHKDQTKHTIVVNNNSVTTTNNSTNVSKLDTLIEPDKILPEEPKITPDHTIKVRNVVTGATQQHTYTVPPTNP